MTTCIACGDELSDDSQLLCAECYDDDRQAALDALVEEDS